MLIHDGKGVAVWSFEKRALVPHQSKKQVAVATPETPATTDKMHSP